MPSSDTHGVDGDFRYGRPLESESPVAGQRSLQPDRTRFRTSDESQSPQASLYGEVTTSKWSPSSADNPRPEMNTSASPTGRFSPVSEDRPLLMRGPRVAANAPYRSNANYAAAATVAEPLDSSETASSLAGLRERAQAFLGDQISPIRLASHLAVIAVAAVVLIVSQIEMPSWEFSLRSLPDDGLFAPVENSVLNGVNSTGAASEAAETFHRAVIPFTNPQAQQQNIPAAQQAVAAPIQPAPQSLVTARDQIETYTVRSGDTVLGIAARFNLQPETIQWANPELESNPDLLRVGDRLVILPVDGALHVVQSGDTLSTIAAKYKVTTDAIASFALNRLADAGTPIAVGQQLVIPNGTKPYIARQVVAYSGPIPESATQGSGIFGWPTAGTITQQYWNGHRAIDVGAWAGTSVTAADSGYVIAARSGWNGGYGTMVMIDHGNGYVTLYAHMNSIFVRQGENVSRGQQVGAVGNTGNSTGPHLHFEVRYQGVPRNPFNFLP